MYTFVCFLLLSFSNCQSDNENQEINIEGNWQMKNIRGGLTGINENYGLGVLTLKFDSSNMSLIISKSDDITTSQEELFYREFEFENSDFTSTDYNISVLEGLNTLFVDNVKIGNMEIRGNSLFIDKGIALDGVLIELTK